MRTLTLVLALAIGSTATAALAQGPYRIVQTVKAGGDGGFDYVYADSVGRKLYIPRSGPMGRVMVLDLDTLASVGEFAVSGGHGAAVDPKSGHGFSSSKPLAMWDSKTLAPIKTIDPQGNPDGILGDPASGKVYVLSHSAPNVTVINAADGAVAGTIDLGGAPEQAVTDGKGHLYIDLEDKDQVAVVDAASMTKTGVYGLDGKCGTPAGLAIDARNHILFVACRNPATMTMLNADTGKILGSVPIGAGVDGAVFNPATLEAFSSQGDGTLTVVKETSPTTFAVEQTVQTPIGAKTLTLDAKTGHVLLITAEFARPPVPPPADVTSAPPPGAPAGPPGRPRRGPMLPGSFSVIVVGK
jgi:DNA-binding beta-propeller fold protein YncE